MQYLLVNFGAGYCLHHFLHNQRQCLTTSLLVRMFTACGIHRDIGIHEYHQFPNLFSRHDHDTFHP